MSESTTNKPLTSSGQAKLLIFGLLLLPTLFFVGVVPVIFLAFGMWMLKRNEDFSHIETAVRNMRAYYFVAFSACALFAAWFGYAYAQEPESWSRHYILDTAIGWTVAAVVAMSYFVLAKVLLLAPMRGHEKWVETNGIFSTKAKAIAPVTKQAGVDIVQGGRMSPYSVADELLKWSKLKEDGHITVDQYNAAKDKLLNTPAS